MNESCFRTIKTGFDARPVHLQRDDLTNVLHGSAGFRTDTQIAPKQRMEKIISATRL